MNTFTCESECEIKGNVGRLASEDCQKEKTCQETLQVEGKNPFNQNLVKNLWQRVIILMDKLDLKRLNHEASTKAL